MSQPSQSTSSTNTTAYATVTAESLNRGCACRTLDPERLRRQMEAEPALAGLFEDIARSRPNLFSVVLDGQMVLNGLPRTEEIEVWLRLNFASGNT